MHLTPTLGTEVTQPSGDLRALLAERHVLFFRGLDLTPKALIDFGSQFGDLVPHPRADRRMPGFDLITPVRTDANTKVAFGESWHSDQSAEREPTALTMLYITRVPDSGGGDTLFANMHRAYETLSPTFKQVLGDLRLTAIHSAQKPLIPGYITYGPDKPQAAEHPLVIEHPVSKRPALFCSPTSAVRIPQLSWDESDGILGALWKHMLNPRFQCRFKWTPGTLAVWDNRSVMHHAIWDFYPEVREGLRLITKGEGLRAARKAAYTETAPAQVNPC